MRGREQMGMDFALDNIFFGPRRSRIWNIASSRAFGYRRLGNPHPVYEST